MAKRSSADGVNKSAAIREILKQNPKTPAKEVVSQLAAKNVEVNANLVYLIKSKQSKRVRRERRAQAVQAVAANRKAGLANPVELIRQIRKCAEQAGGMKHLKELVELLAQ